jgi:branched-chain amino acid transport system permease protein
MKNLRKKSNDWFFGLNGLQTFVISAVLIVAISMTKVMPTYGQHILVNCLLNATLALGLNFIAGYLGQTSLGHAVFYGLGAYTTATVLKYTGLSFWITIPLGMVIAAIVAVPLALASLRVKGQFLIVITYAFCEIFRYIAINTQSLGGTGGISGLKSPEIFGMKLTKLAATNKGGYMILLFLIVAAVAYFSWRIERSRVGYAFAAIREDEIAAVAMGINVKYYKVLAMMISAVICSVAGSIQAVFASMVSPELFSSTKSIQILTMVVIGGRMSIPGMILGGALLTIIPEIFHSVKDMVGLSFDPWMILYGFLLVSMMRFRPQGILGKKDKADGSEEPAAPSGNASGEKNLSGADDAAGKKDKEV